ncbi:MAG: type II secretion system F family protein, partial [Nitrospirae bacterium]
MKIFRYKAVDPEGKTITGMLQAADLEGVEQGLISLGLQPLSIRPVGKGLSRFLSYLLSRKIKRKDIIEFSNNLSVMLRAGIPLLDALQDISETTENSYFRQNLNAIVRAIQMGSTLTDAVSAHRDIFPDIFIRLVSVGEETGRLDQSLKDVAEHLQRLETLSAAIKRALIYPAFAIVSTFGAMVFWLVYVLPKLAALFRDMQIPLPGITRAMIWLSDVTTRWWYVGVLFVLFVFVCYKFLKRYRSFRLRADGLKLRLPIVKLIVHNKALGLFSEQMRILLVAGLSIDRVFDLVADVMDNEVMKQAVTTSRDDILAGTSIAEALRKHPVFPVMLIRMVHVGEKTGDLENQFSFLSGHFLEILDDITQKIGKMLEPVVIGVIGLFFVFIILGLLLPVYDLVSKIGAG